MLEFMKLFADMEQLFEPFSQEEKGNLLDAMMAYTFHGVEPMFTGNERYIWPVLRRHFDQCTAANEKNAANGVKGGRPKNPAKPKETERNPEKPRDTQRNPEKAIQEQEQEQEHIQEQEQEQEQEQYYAREETAPAVVGIDGTDLSETIRRNELADDLVRAYNLNRDEPTRLALLNDLEFYGEKRMRETLERACQSNSRERVTVNFWRAILQGKGRDSQKDTGVNYGQVLRQREYSNDQFSAMEVDPDALDDHGRLPGEPGYGT